MFQPADCDFGDQTMQPGSSRLVGVNFAGGSKKNYVLSEVQDSMVDALFALSAENKSDASAIVGMFGKDQMWPMPAGKDTAIRDLLNAQNLSMVARNMVARSNRPRCQALSLPLASPQ
jgi:hypothetical protein